MGARPGNVIGPGGGLVIGPPVGLKVPVTSARLGIWKSPLRSLRNQPPTKPRARVTAPCANCSRVSIGSCTSARTVATTPAIFSVTSCSSARTKLPTACATRPSASPTCCIFAVTACVAWAMTWVTCATTRLTPPCSAATTEPTIVVVRSSKICRTARALCRAASPSACSALAPLSPGRAATSGAPPDEPGCAPAAAGRSASAMARRCWSRLARIAVTACWRAVSSDCTACASMRLRVGTTVTASTLRRAAMTVPTSRDSPVATACTPRWMVAPACASADVAAWRTPFSRLPRSCAPLCSAAPIRSRTRPRPPLRATAARSARPAAAARTVATPGRSGNGTERIAPAICPPICCTRCCSVPVAPATKPSIDLRAPCTWASAAVTVVVTASCALRMVAAAAAPTSAPLAAK